MEYRERNPAGNDNATRRVMEHGGLVSVIIPVFNVRPYLAQALNSVLRQTYENLEIIVIDDGSTDGSGEICDQYAEKDRRVLVVHQQNEGLSTARNVGLERAGGEVIAFLDSDDAYRETCIKEMMAAMVRDHADLVVCKYTAQYSEGPLRYRAKGKTSPAIGQGIYDRVSALRALADGTINTSVWNKLYRRELWNGIRFPDKHVYEDAEITFRIIDICGKISVLDRTLYLYRKRPGSITDTPSRNSIRDKILVRSCIDSFMKMRTPAIFDPDQLTKARRRRFNSSMSIYIRYSCRAGKDREAFAEEMRAQIIAEGREIGVETFGPRSWVVYDMILFCPWLLKAIYPVYRYIRRKTIGR